MKVTEVRIRIVRENDKEKLRAFSSLTFDNSFVVREVKVIEGDKGLFVAMPSRKVTSRCRKCGGRNVIQAQFCNNCGQKLEEYGQYRISGGQAQQEKMYMDVAHPINADCRRMIHDAVIGAYHAELERYKSRPSHEREKYHEAEHDEHEFVRQLDAAGEDENGGFSHGIFA